MAAAITDISGRLELSGEAAPTVAMDSPAGGTLELPGGLSLSTATFAASGSNLVLTWGDGTQVVVRGYFEADPRPSIASDDGVSADGELVGQLAGAGAPVAVEAPAGDEYSAGTDTQPIGTVEKANGTVTATRADGTVVELGVGDPVFQGDQLATGPDGAVGIILADETTFSMAENGQMVLDEMVYDPSTKEGNIAINVVQGVFTFVSGEIAKTDPDAMTLETPVATIGIRGTQVGLDIKDGQNLTVVLMEESDGFVGEVVVMNKGGLEVMNMASQFTRVTEFSLSPWPVSFLKEEDLTRGFATPLQYLPIKGDSSANDYGLQGSLDAGDKKSAEDLANFDTAAGPQAPSDINVVYGDAYRSQIQVERPDFQFQLGDAAGRENVQVVQVGSDVIIGGQVASSTEDFLVGGVYTRQVSGFYDGSAITLNQHITGSEGADTIITGTGDDTLIGSGGDDILSGGDGDDTLYGTAGDDTVFAGGGNDVIVAGTGAGFDTYDGGDGVDLITYESATEGVYVNLAVGTAHDIRLGTTEVIVDDPTPRTDGVAYIDIDVLRNIENVLGSPGDDIIIGDDFANLLMGGGGDDALMGGGGDDVLDGGSGSDVLVGGSGLDTAVFSGNRSEYVITVDNATGEVLVEHLAGGGADGVTTLIGIESLAFKDGQFSLVVGDDSAEEIIGSDASDTIIGGGGDDVIVGGGGDDDIDGGTGNDTIDGGAGDDVIRGSQDNDVLVGGIGDDTILGGGGNDVIEGGAGNDVIDAGAGNDLVDGGTGNDVIMGGDNDDVLFGGAGDDTIVGGGGNDTIDGGAGNDVLEGDAGDDVLITGEGNDVVRGGDGVDTAVFAGNRADFEIGVDAASGLVSVTNTASGEVSTLEDVELLRFDDGTIALGAAPVVTVEPAAGDEDTAIALNIGVTIESPLAELASVTITGVPEGAMLSAGSDNGDGSWTLSGADLDQLSTLTVTAPPDFNGTLALSVSATASDGQTSAEAATLTVDVAAVAEETSLNISVDGEAVSAPGTYGVGEEVAGGSATMTYEDADSVTLTAHDGGTVTVAGDGGSEVTVQGFEDVAIDLGDGGDSTVTVDAAAGGEIVTGDGDDAVFVAATGTNSEGDQVFNISTGAGNDSITLSGDDSLTAFDVAAGAGDDTIVVDPEADYALAQIYGGAGDDRIFGGAADDVLIGGEGDDLLFGGAGGDTLIGGGGNDVLDGGAGDDVGVYVVGDNVGQHDVFDGGEGQDVLRLVMTQAEYENPAFRAELEAFRTLLEGGADTVGGLESQAFTFESIGLTVNNFEGLDVIVDGEPTLSLGTAVGLEDTAIPLDISVALAGVEDTFSIAIAGVPEGAVLSAGTDNGDGTWTLTPGELEGLSITPPADSSADFQLTVTASAVDAQGQPVSVTDTMTVEVTGVADAATLELGQVSGSEDNVIPLTITAGLTDTDGSETLSITIAGVPPGGFLSAGTDNGDGSWTLAPDQLDGLTLTPPLNMSGEFQLSVTATTAEDDGDSTSVSGVMNVSLVGGADAPSLVLGAAAGLEDAAIPLDVQAALTDPGEVLSVTISGVPEGAQLSAGTDNGDGTWTLTPDQLTGLSVTPPSNANEDFALTVTATSTDGVSTASTTGTIDVAVAGVADVPALTASVGEGIPVTAEAVPGWGHGDAIHPHDGPPGLVGAVDDVTGEVAGVVYPLLVESALTDTDGSETLSVTISGIPVGVVLSAGTDNGDGSWSLTTGQMDGLQMFVPSGVPADFSLTVTATATEDDGDTASRSTVVSVSGADTPTLDLDDAAGLEDTAIALDVQAVLTDESEVLSVTISGVPEDAVLSAGTDNGDGTWTLNPEQLAGLTITPPSNSDEDFTLTVTATSSDGDTTASKTGTLTVQVAGVADAPAVAVADATGDEDTAIPLDISAALTDTDGSETLSITLAGVPVGATLSAGTDNGDGTWTLTGGDLDGLTITPPADSNADFALTVTATSVDGDSTASTTGTVTVQVAGVADAPTLEASIGAGVPTGDDALGGWGHGDGHHTHDGPPGQGSGHGSGGDSGAGAAIAYPLDIRAALTDADGSETLSIVVAGVPSGATLSAGTDNGDGTWTLGSADLAGLTLTVPNPVPQDFSLTVTATSTEDDGDTASRATVISISGADRPTLAVEDAAGSEDTAIPLSIEAALTDASETLAITIAGVPVGATLSAGTDNGDGTWSLAGNELDGLSITPPADSNADFTLTVTATSSDGSASAWATQTLAVDVAGVADTPSVSAGDAEGHEDQWIQLHLDGALADADGSETLAVAISGVPEGAQLSHGSLVGDGVWTVAPADLHLVSILPPENFVGDIPLTLALTSTEDDGDMATVSQPFSVTVTDSGFVTTIRTTGGIALSEDGAASSAAQTDADLDGQAGDLAGVQSVSLGAWISLDRSDSSEEVTELVLTDVPADASIVVGGVALSPSQAAGGVATYVVSGEALDAFFADSSALRMEIPQHGDTDAHIGVGVTVREGDRVETLWASERIDVTVDAVADKPFEVAATAEVHEGGESVSLTTPDRDVNVSEVASQWADEGITVQALRYDSSTGEWSDAPLGTKNVQFSLDGSNTSDTSLHGSYAYSGIAVGGGIDGGETDVGAGGATEMMRLAFAEPMSSVTVALSALFDGETAATSEHGPYDAGYLEKVQVTAHGADGRTYSTVINGTVTGLATATIDAGFPITYLDMQPLDDGAGANGNNSDFLLRSVSGTTWSEFEDQSVTVTVAARFADFADGSEAHWLLVELPDGWQGPEGVELVSGAEFDGLPDKTFMRLEVDNADLVATDGLASVPLTLRGPAESSHGEMTLEVFAQSAETAADDLDGSNNVTFTGGEVTFDLGEEDPSVPGATLIGGSGADTITGTAGDDLIYGIGGRDTLDGAAGDDVIYGGKGDDKLYGGDGQDTVYGDSGDDKLYGGAGNDSLDGGKGEDTLYGGAGDDILTGGGHDSGHGSGHGSGHEADVFVFDAESGKDIITDIFSNDQLVFEGQEFHADDMIFNENEAGDVVISFSNVDNVSVTLNGVTLDDVQTGNGYTVQQDADKVVVTLNVDDNQ